MNRFRVSSELMLPFATVGLAMAIYLTLMLVNLVGIRNQLVPLTDPLYMVANLEANSLEGVIKEFAATGEDIERLSEDLGPIEWFGRHLNWFPIVGPASSSVTNLLDRTVEDLAVFNSTAQSIDRASDLLSQQSGGSSANRDRLVQDLEDLQSTWAASIARLDNAAENHPASWPLHSQFDRIESAERQLIEVSQWGIELLDATTQLLLLSEDIEQLFLSIDDFEEAVVASDQLAVELEELSASTTAVRTRFDQTILGTPVLIRDVPAVQQVHDLHDALKVAENAINGSARLSSAMNQVMDELDSSISGSFTPGGPINGISRKLFERSDEFVTASELLSDSYSNSNQLHEFLGPDSSARFERIMGKISGFAHVLAAISPVLPELVGTNEPVEYLVLGQTSDELRANGGFVSSAWVMEIINGGISQVEYENVRFVDNIDDLTNYPSAPQPLREHMNAPVSLIRDATWDPHFPAAAETALELYEIGQNKRLSHVIAINVFAISRLVDALGGIHVRDQLVTSDEISKVIETETDEYGTVFLQVIFDSLIEELAEPRSKVDLAGVALAIFESFSTRELIVYSSVESVGSQLNLAGWDGSLDSTFDSRYYITDSNVGWNKVDRNIARLASYEIEFKSDGSTVTTLKSTYVNNSGPHVDFLGCDRQWHPLTDEYAALLNGCYWNYLQIYAPGDSSITDASTMPLPEGAVYAEFGTGIAGESTLSIAQTSVGQKIEGLIALPAGEQRELTFQFNDSAAWIPDRDISEHRIELRAQPGVRSRETTVEISAPDGYAINVVAADAHIDSTTSGTLSFTQTKDEVIIVRLLKK